MRRSEAGLLARVAPVLVTAAIAGCDGNTPTVGEPEGTDPSTQESELVLAAGQSLVAGEKHTCALLSSGAVRCWGDNYWGQLGRSAKAPSGTYAPQDPLSNSTAAFSHSVNLGSRRTAKAIAAAVDGHHTCAILENDQLKCWGRNELGQLGLEDTLNRGRVTDETFQRDAGGMGDSLPAVNLGTGRTAKAVAAGSGHTCAILDTNQVKCWGSPAAGALGYGSRNGRGAVPGTMGDNLPVVDLGTGRTAKALAATGSQVTCAILDNNKVKCWGSRSYCALGSNPPSQLYGYGEDPGTMGDSLPYVDIGTGRTALAIGAGWGFVCVLRDNGTVKCWGFSGYGEAGNGSTGQWGCNAAEMGDAGIVSMGGNDVTAIGLGANHACARRSNGEVKCWGNNGSGRLGVNVDPIPFTLTTPSAPLSFGTSVQARALAGGGQHTCMISTANKAKCWGSNASGQLGTNITAPAVGDVAGEMGNNLLYSDLHSRPVSQIASGWVHHCAILSGGTVKCWGLNSDGQLGVGDFNNRGDNAGEMGSTLPGLLLGSGRTGKSLGLGGYHSCAALDNNTLKCWGSNTNGQLGYNDTTLRTSPPSTSTVSLGTGLTVHTTAANPVTAGYAHTCALLSNNQIKCWGFNAEGQLGYGDTTDRLAPPSGNVNLGFGRTAKAVSAGNQHTCAILDTNQVKCWGAGWSGQLGDGGTNPVLSPPSATVSLGTGRSAKAISGKGDNTCAWLDNDQIKCWGANWSGQAGVGSTTNQLVPPSATVNLGTSHSALAVAAGGGHACALLATNQVKCWGENGGWQLGTWQDQSSTTDFQVGNGPNEMGDFLATVFQGAGRHVKAISAGTDTTCFLLDTDQVRCTGLNSSGELGVGTTNVYPPNDQGAGIVDFGPDP